MEKTTLGTKPASVKAEDRPGAGKNATREAQAAALRRNLQRRKQAVKAPKTASGED